MKTCSLATIGITMGDAAGVGPEIIMKSLDHADLYERCRPLVIGDATRLSEAGRIVLNQLEVNAIEDPAEAKFTPGTVDCIDLKLIPAGLPWGKLSAICGDAAYQYLARAVELATAGKIDAICTAPLNKEALHAGGHRFPGHTEMLAHLTGTPEVSMIAFHPKAQGHSRHYAYRLDRRNRQDRARLGGADDHPRARHSRARGEQKSKNRCLRHQPARRRAWSIRVRRGRIQNRTGYPSLSGPRLER